MSGENRGQVIRSYFASRAIENRSWCICSIGETIEVGHEGKVFHISCGQRKACDVLKQQTRGNRRGNGKTTIRIQTRTTARRGVPFTKFPGQKWESNIQQWDKEPNPSKILCLMWDKREDTLEIQVKMKENSSVTKGSILSQLSAI